MPYIGSYIWQTAVFRCPSAALLGHFFVVWLTQDVARSVIAGIAGLVVGFVVAGVGEARLGDESQAGEPIDPDDEWPEAIAIVVFPAIFLGAPVAALAVTLVAGWLLAG